jgi:hypothetical protein
MLAGGIALQRRSKRRAPSSASISMLLFSNEKQWSTLSPALAGDAVLLRGVPPVTVHVRSLWARSSPVPGNGWKLGLRRSARDVTLEPNDLAGTSRAWRVHDPATESDRADIFGVEIAPSTSEKLGAGTLPHAMDRNP